MAILYYGPIGFLPNILIRYFCNIVVAEILYFTSVSCQDGKIPRRKYLVQSLFFMMLPRKQNAELSVTKKRFIITENNVFYHTKTLYNVSKSMIR